MKFILLRILRFDSFKVRYRSSDVRVRFAPSPTGYLHLGGLRTALYNFLFAGSQKGKFILRIEDTDRKRLVEGAAQALEDDLNWLGLTPDESPSKGGEYGSYVQSERTELYKKEALKLIENGSAYYCFCTERRLEMLRRNAIRNNEVPKYDNHCRKLSAEEVQSKLDVNTEKCVRLKLTSSQGFNDIIYGHVHHPVENVEGDPVILKKDCLPTYHLASVIDDHFMKISHVIRGVEWLQSTDKHLMIYRALGYKPPVFAHLPLLLNTDGSKLSKRQGDISLKSLRKKGVEPRALINFLSSVGGGFKKSKPNNASLHELSEFFDISLINSNSTKLPLNRLDDYNNVELTRLINSQHIDYLIENLKSLLISNYSEEYENKLLLVEDNYIVSVLKYFNSRISYLNDLLHTNLKFIWVKPNLNGLEDNSKSLLIKLEPILQECDFNKKILSLVLKEFAKTNDIEFKKLMHLLRDVLCGLKEGPGVAEMMELLGKETTINRIHNAANFEGNTKENR